MDKELRESLMEWYLLYGERPVLWNIMHDTGPESYGRLRELWWDSTLTEYSDDKKEAKQLTHKALDYLKTKAYNGSSINTDKE